MLKKTVLNKNCHHCQDVIPTSRVGKFCCDGCETVYLCLNSNGLENFYHILDSENKKLPSVKPINEYLYLSDPAFQKDFGQGEKKLSFWFYVNGVECLACTWLFNHLPKLYMGISKNQFFPDRNILSIEVDNLETLKESISFIGSFGFKLVPLKNISEADEKLKAEKKKQIRRIGIVGAIWMNLMIYSISIYAGAKGFYSEIFSHIQAIIFLPVCTYGAWPFLQNLYQQIKNRHLSIDFPLSLSIVLGSLLSYYHYLIGSTEYYFDSLATFIFLILSVRYFLKFVFQKEIKRNALEGVYGSQQVRLETINGIVHKHISQIKNGDIIHVDTNEVAPLEGIHILTNRLFNESLITGESAPVTKSKKDKIRAGSINISEPTKIEVTDTKEHNIFKEYLEAIRFDVSTLNRYSLIGQKYTILLLAIQSLLTIYFYYSFELEQAHLMTLSMLIVCCPCALGIGIPLASLLKMKSMTRQGILVKNSLVLEKMNQVKSIIFDKTGTITNGNLVLNSFQGETRFLPIINSMEIKSPHPIGQLLLNEFSQFGFAKLHSLTEEPGKGPKAIYQEKEYMFEHGKNGFLNFLENKRIVMSFDITEMIPKENISCLNSLSKEYDLSILTGDSSEKSNRLVESLKIKNLKVFSEKDPHQKELIIKDFPHTLYMGDGLNDILALKNAFVSISTNANQMTDDAADVVLLNGGPKKILKLMKEIKHLNLILNTNILLSVIYNLIAIALILHGLISPLVAAILMPISSIIIFLHIYFRMNFYHSREVN